MPWSPWEEHYFNKGLATEAPGIGIPAWLFVVCARLGIDMFYEKMKLFKSLWVVRKRVSFRVSEKT